MQTEEQRERVKTETEMKAGRTKIVVSLLRNVIFAIRFSTSDFKGSFFLLIRHCFIKKKKRKKKRETPAAQGRFFKLLVLSERESTIII